jgi:hypothetical protein
MSLEMQRLSRRAILGRRMTPTRLITSVSSTSENQSFQRARILPCPRFEIRMATT